MNVEWITFSVDVDCKTVSLFPWAIFVHFLSKTFANFDLNTIYSRVHIDAHYFNKENLNSEVSKFPSIYCLEACWFFLANQSEF